MFQPHSNGQTRGHRKRRRSRDGGALSHSRGVITSHILSHSCWATRVEGHSCWRLTVLTHWSVLLGLHCSLAPNFIMEGHGLFFACLSLFVSLSALFCSLFSFFHGLCVWFNVFSCCFMVRIDLFIELVLNQALITYFLICLVIWVCWIFALSLYLFILA